MKQKNSDMKNKKNIKDLLKSLKIETENEQYYIEALTHGSYVNEVKSLTNKVLKDYQRLEILGDSIVGKIVTEYFFKKHPEWSEEQINDAKKLVVQNYSMVKASNELDLISYARLGNGVEIDKGTKKIREDIYESFTGALYLDKGEQACVDFVKKTIIKYYLNNELQVNIDYKTRIQEIFQSKEFRHGDKKQNKIIYQKSIKDDGMFESKLIYNENVYGIGVGKTIKKAEQAAAKDAWDKLETNDIN